MESIIFTDSLQHGCIWYKLEKFRSWSRHRDMQIYCLENWCSTPEVSVHFQRRFLFIYLSYQVALINYSSNRKSKNEWLYRSQWNSCTLHKTYPHTPTNFFFSVQLIHYVEKYFVIWMSKMELLFRIHHTFIKNNAHYWLMTDWMLSCDMKGHTLSVLHVATFLSGISTPPA